MHLREPCALPAAGRRAGYKLSRTRPTASSATTWEGSPSIPANVIWYQYSPGGATYPMFQPSVMTPPSPAGVRVGVASASGLYAARIFESPRVSWRLGWDEHVEVELAWHRAQWVRSAYHQDSHTAGQAIAERIVATLHTCPIPEVARFRATLRRWRREFFGYFDIGGASNGGTEAVNGLIEATAASPRGLRNRDKYRIRMLIAGGPPL